MAACCCAGEGLQRLQRAAFACQVVQGESAEVGERRGDPDYDDEDEWQQTRAAASSGARARPHRSGVSGVPTSDSSPATTAENEPVLREASDGGVQGLGWFAASQLRDQHGDYANEFLHEDVAAAPASTTRPGTTAAPAGRTADGAAGGGRRPRAGGAAAKGQGSGSLQVAVEPLLVKSVQQGTVVLGPAEGKPGR
ncbi:hypothetical protein TSOC_001697 [Tetrabaena socialis]|uniref:Uncharacterized protein n=1 Tax=Tetrabaena socialis TaxID=47790 RepID=A0A2J8AG32_9CHLO|nr:hypothetical protein TSOC_001697 [Tetrabaena socialis]|eukprot:PNH11483.1 hypothetical protein TSOC_001697 [Tetrabaena socialis]